MPSRSLTLGCLAFASLVLVTAAAVAGWSSNGETIFLRLAEAAWATCF